MSTFDDLSLYLDKHLRSSNFVLEAWELIESDILYAIGISEKSIMTVYIDNDSIGMFITAECMHSGECNVLCSKIKQFNANHSLSAMTDMSIAVSINFILSERCKTEYKKSSFYFEKNNADDPGGIEIECDSCYNIETYNDFKLEIVMSIVEELQFLIHRNILKRDIETCNISNIDAKFEMASVYTKIKKASFSQAVAALLINNKINSKESKELLKTQRRITSENRRR